MGDIHPQHAARVVKACAIVDADVMAFARHHEIIVPVITHLDGPARARGHHRTGNRQRIALAFLAAKAAAHPPHLYPHAMHGHAQRIGHLVLDLGRMLA